MTVLAVNASDWMLFGWLFFLHFLDRLSGGRLSIKVVNRCVDMRGLAVHIRCFALFHCFYWCACQPKLLDLLSSISVGALYAGPMLPATIKAFKRPG